MPRRTRVLHVLKRYRPVFAGEGVFLERCSAVMQALAPEIEHDLLVTVTPKPEQVLPICSTLRLVCYLDRPDRPAWRHELALVWWFVRNLHRYDTVHFRTHADWYFLTYLLVRLFGRRLVLSATLDDSAPALVAQYRRALRGIARRVFQRFDAFVSISPKLQQQTAAMLDPARCHLVPCGISLPRVDPARARRTRARLGIHPDALVLVFVGGLCARKDPSLLVRLLPEVLRVRPDTTLLLVGPELEADYVTEIRSLIRELGVDKRVVFIGEVSDPHPYLEAADIMTFASHLEGFGTVVPEAQANGLPVVVRHLPGVNDLFVIHGETGFLFTEDQGYLDAVLRLATAPALRARIGAQAQTLVQATFGMEQVARRYLSIYGFPLQAAAAPAHVPLQGTQAPDAAAAEPAWHQRVEDIGTSASVLNRRFHRPAPTERIARPTLLTIIDAEEAFDWGRPFSRDEIDVASMAHQGPAHRVFERYGVVPTYMVDYPVATQDAGRAPLRELLSQGACDIGAQLHPWVTPPFIEEVSRRNSYPGSLPLPIELAKIQALTEIIESTFGARPRIYRAGRYGAGPRTADILKALGYHADSSVMPRWNFSRQDGPDFMSLSAAPFWLDGERRLLEIPGSAATVGALSHLSPALDRAVFSGLGEQLGLTSSMARLRLLERIKITPEGITIAEAKRLVRHMAANGHKLFVLTYHTPSLVPGNTPYVRTGEDVRRFLAWLDEFYDFFARDVGGASSTWRAVHAALLDTPSPAATLRLPIAA